MDIRFEQLSFGRLPQIAALEKECFSEPWSGAGLAAELENKNAFYILAVASETKAEQIAGYAGFHLIIDEIEIMRVAVSPAYRRKGLAERMLRMMEAEWVDYDIVSAFLEVRASNCAARALYEKLGFREIYVRRRYYGNGENAVIMRKEYQER